jgi:hypothetical protein
MFFSDAGQGAGTANGLNLLHRYASISAFITGWNNISSAGGMDFVTKATTGAELTSKLRINPNGDIGIGTTSPTQKIDVSGSIRVRSGFGYTSDFSGGVFGISILNVDGSDNVVIGSTFSPKNVMLTSGIRYDFASTGLGINVTSPTLDTDVANKYYVDSRTISTIVGNFTQGYLIFGGTEANTIEGSNNFLITNNLVFLDKNFTFNIFLPITSCDLKPSQSSSLLFKSIIFPFLSKITIASGEYSKICLNLFSKAFN